jgi:hypothetical protein
MHCCKLSEAASTLGAARTMSTGPAMTVKSTENYMLAYTIESNMCTGLGAAQYYGAAAALNVCFPGLGIVNYQCAACLHDGLLTFWVTISSFTNPRTVGLRFVKEQPLSGNFPPPPLPPTYPHHAAYVIVCRTCQHGGFGKTQ